MADHWLRKAFLDLLKNDRSFRYLPFDHFENGNKIRFVRDRRYKIFLRALSSNV